MDVRLAKVEELDVVYMMGYDVWSDGASAQVYLAGCRASEKYRMGKWYVLADEEGVYSSLVVYSSVFGIPPDYCGVGSIATDRLKRNRGYAHQLLNTVCEILQHEGAKGVYLHSDIEVSFYERLGFRVMSPETTCMVRTFYPLLQLPEEIPAYF